MKIIAFYLPQFHSIPENDEWWGEGFTEWTNVKKAKPLFKGHEQPVIPLNHNYYNLLDINTIKWQSNLAKSYGIYGFCIYHYWFNGKLLLEKPLELLRDSKDIRINYCICWANEHWTNSWNSNNEEIIVEQNYGDIDDWKKHFDYLYSFFIDERYIKEDNKPLLIIYRPELIENLNTMLDFWNSCAIEKGFSGIKFAYQHIGLDLKKDKDDSRFDYDIEYQPMYALKEKQSFFYKNIKKISLIVNQVLFKNKNVYIFSNSFKKVRKFDYDDIWQTILKMKVSKKSIPGAFVRWDNTPRKGKSGLISINVSPEKFYKYLKIQLIRAKEVYNTDKLFLFAWNEWAEGGYLEPDDKNGYKYLEAVKKAINEIN